MNKRDAAMAWVEKHRPDCTERVRAIFDMHNDNPRDDRAQALMLVMYFAFEGGRQFQHDTGAELGNPGVYL